MKLDKAGLQLIAKWEGRRATAYQDSAGLWTIGIGHLIKSNEQHLRTATLTDADIDALFASDVAWAEEAVTRLFPSVTRQSEFNALVSLTYNLGESQIAGSTLRDVITNNGTPQAIRTQWYRWTIAGGQQVPGLLNRRIAEFRHYMSGYATMFVLFLLIAAMCMGIGGAMLINA